MNRIYLIAQDGRIFFADKSSETFELLNIDESLKFKKLSSSELGLWAISSSFQIYLYAYEFDTPFECQEVTYENQRRYNLLSAKSFTDKLLITDRWKFSSEDGVYEMKKDDFKLPSDCWKWNSDWVYEQNISDGWEYAIDFPSIYYPKFSKTSLVRRRKWTRNRIFTRYNEFIPIKCPIKDECIVDISCGGWSMPYSTKGFTCVWIVSNIGNLFFRKNVSLRNPEGSEWTQIELPDRNGVFLCSASSNGNLWAVNFFGIALMRTGITRENPSGNGWLEIDQGTITHGIKQISLGENSVWALDNQGNVFYRAGITELKPEGTQWVHIPANMSNISVSFTGQLWAIDINESSLNYREGISSENPSGKNWHKIELKCRKINRSSTMNQLSDIIRSKEELREVETNGTPLLPAVRDSHYFLPASEPKHEEPKFFIEDSLFDTIYETQSFETNEIEIKSGKNKFAAQSENKESELSSLVIDNNFKNIKNTLEETEFEEFINKIRDSNEQVVRDEKQDHSKSTLSIDSYDSSLSLKRDFNETFNNLEKSNYSQEFEDTLSLNSQQGSEVSSDLTVIGFRVCTANNFRFDNMSSWFNKNVSIIRDSQLDDIKVKLNELMRDIILKDLKLRNLRENVNVDKISIPYENSTWSHVEELTYLHENKLKPCIFEVITGDNKQSKLFNQLYAKDKNARINILNVNLVIKSAVKARKQWEIRLNFKDFILITRWVLDKKTTQPCFAIFTRSKQVHIFSLASEKVLSQWNAQISVYCSRMSSVKSGITSLLAASTITNINGFVYYAYMQNDQIVFMKQIDGSLKYCEKHTSGVTFGVGRNGKLWVLDTQNNISLDSYKGPYTQIDECELNSYENQRWNALSGLLGVKDGYTQIGFPTDRYHYSDESGKEKRNKEDCHLPTSQSRWLTKWQVDFLTPGGVDKEGWQYAFDFPQPYHGIRIPLKDFVRRRRWIRKYRNKVNGTLWKEIPQTHKITSIAMDQEIQNTYLLPKNMILVWATDIDGFLLVSLIDQMQPSLFRWQHVSSTENFKNISIGVNLRVWGISLSGNVYYRFGVDKRSNYCGTNWSLIENSPAEIDLRFKQVSVGNDTVWAISTTNVLYFRENVSRSFPQGTAWTRINASIKYVTVNCHNQVYAVTSEEDKNKGTVLFREGVTKSNPKGLEWIKLLSV